MMTRRGLKTPLSRAETGSKGPVKAADESEMIESVKKMFQVWGRRWGCMSAMVNWSIDRKYMASGSIVMAYPTHRFLHTVHCDSCR